MLAAAAVATFAAFTAFGSLVAPSIVAYGASGHSETAIAAFTAESTKTAFASLADCIHTVPVYHVGASRHIDADRSATTVATAASFTTLTTGTATAAFSRTVDNLCVAHIVSSNKCYGFVKKTQHFGGIIVVAQTRYSRYKTQRTDTAGTTAAAAATAGTIATFRAIAGYIIINKIVVRIDRLIRIVSSVIVACSILTVFARIGSGVFRTAAARQRKQVQ
jgi:hypothetical protein